MTFAEAEKTAINSASTASPMPLYRCHKEVYALKIKEVIPTPKPTISELDDILNEKEMVNALNMKRSEIGGFIVPEGHFAPIPLDREWFGKHLPQAGGYLVFYKDGYRSFSPAQAFEEGYTRV